MSTIKSSDDSGQTILTQEMISPTCAGRYRLVRIIGEGGMGNVYLAEDLQLPRQVAIKTIRPELIENEEVRKRIERECRMHARIGVHPHIIALYDQLVDGKNLSLIMEYFEGVTLADRLASLRKAGRHLSVQQAVNILLQLLDALSCIHREGIIHRDIKPSNLLVRTQEDGRYLAKLMDFGIARSELEDSDLTRLTVLDAGGPGTPAYMAPERIDCKTFGDICPATDVYASGVILYEMLAHEPPFLGTITEIFSGHLTQPPDLDKLRGVPERIVQVLDTALQKHPEKRFGEAKLFAEALEKAVQVTASEQPETNEGLDDRTLVAAVAEVLPDSTLLDTKTTLPGSGGRKTSFIWLLGGAVVLLALIAVLLLTTRQVEKSPDSKRAEVVPARQEDTGHRDNRGEETRQNPVKQKSSIGSITGENPAQAPTPGTKKGALAENNISQQGPSARGPVVKQDSDQEKVHPRESVSASSALEQLRAGRKKKGSIDHGNPSSTPTAPTPIQPAPASPQKPEKRSQPKRSIWHIVKERTTPAY